jgi:hypothetical protein
MIEVGRQRRRFETKVPLQPLAHLVTDRPASFVVDVDVVRDAPMGFHFATSRLDPTKSPSHRSAKCSASIDRICMKDADGSIHGGPLEAGSAHRISATNSPSFRSRRMPSSRRKLEQRRSRTLPSLLALRQTNRPARSCTNVVDGRRNAHRSTSRGVLHPEHSISSHGYSSLIA